MLRKFQIQTIITLLVCALLAGIAFFTQTCPANDHCGLNAHMTSWMAPQGMGGAL